jgi:hypothetical protein
MNSPAGRNRYTREQFIAFLAAWLRQQPDLTLQVARAEGMKSGFTVGRREFDEARKASLAPPVVPGETPAARTTPSDDFPRDASPRRDDSFGAMPDDEADEPVVTFPPAAPTKTPSAPPVATPEAPLPSYLSARHVPTPPSEPSTFAPKPSYTTRPTSYDRPAASSYDRPSSSSYDRPANYDRPTSYDRPSSYDRQTPADRPGGRNDGPRRFATSFDDAMRDLSSSDAPSGWASRTVAPTSGAPAPTTRPVSQPATSGTAPPAGPDGSSRSNQNAAPPQARSVVPAAMPTAAPPATPAASRPAPPPAAAKAPTAAPGAASTESSSWLVGTVAKKPEASFAEIRAAAVAAGHTAPSPIAFARARRSAAAAAARESSGRDAARSADAAPTPRKGGKAASAAPHSPAEVVEEIRRVSDERARLLEALKRIAKLVDGQGF